MFLSEFLGDECIFQGLGRDRIWTSSGVRGGTPGLMVHEVSRLHETSVCWRRGQRRKSRSDWLVSGKVSLVKETKVGSLKGLFTGAERGLQREPRGKAFWVEQLWGHHHTRSEAREGAIQYTHKWKKQRTSIVKQAVMKSRETRT